MLNEVDHEDFCDQFEATNPAFIAGMQGGQFHAAPLNGQIKVFVDTGEGYFTGNFDPTEFDRLWGELREIPVEELLVRFGPPEIREAYYACSLN